MNRNTALRLVQKLQALTTDRGATGPEAALAAEKADALIARFGLDTHATEEPRPRARRPRAAPAAGSPGWVGGKMFARESNDWRFDIQTAQASSNVKVHSYKNSREWSIEIF
jgi:hypothetical protein